MTVGEGVWVGLGKGSEARRTHGKSAAFVN